MNLFYDRGKHKWKRNLRNNEKWILGIDLRGEFEKWNWDMKLKNDLQNEIEKWIWKLIHLRNEIDFGKLIWEMKLNLGNEFENWISRMNSRSSIEKWIWGIH